MLTRLIIVLLCAVAGFSARADEYDTLRLKWRDTIVGAGYDTADTDVASRLVDIATSANSYWASMDKTLARTFLWSDAASTTISSDITTNYSRLRAMALAYATPGCSLQGNAALLADITGGLDWMDANRYNPTKSIYSNWWDFEIGSPLQLVDIAVLLYDQLTTPQLTNYMNAVEKFTPSATTQAAGGQAGSFTGANRMWKIRIVAVRGAVVKNNVKLTESRDAFSNLFGYVTSGDGFYTDGSFIQHSTIPYTAGYGAALVTTIVPVMALMSGSTWAVTDPTQSNLFKWVYDSYEPIIYRGAALDLVRGREISRSSGSPQATGHGIMDSIMQMAQFAPSADAARMKSMVKYWAQTDTVRNFITARPLPTLTLAKQLMADVSVTPRGELTGHYTFAEMDRVVHLGKSYGFGLSMCSSRIANFESINGENLRGWFTGNGMTTLYNADLNQYGDAYWPTVDSYRLPGVTADPTHNKLPATPGTIGPSAQGQRTVTAYNWVGGATLGAYGAAGMQLDAWGVTLTAKKSWFMFDDEVVCLGAGITSTDSRPIETTVENRKLGSAGTNNFTVNGSFKPTAPGWAETMVGVNWAHLAGSVSGSDIGYYFPQPSTIKAVREARTGAWSEIDDGSSTTAITRNYLRMSFEHGSNPTNAAYQYVLLPDYSAARVSHYAMQPQTTVVANTPNVQAVSETTLGITAANFWSDTIQTAGVITANKKCSVLLRVDGPFTDVSVSDPTQQNTGSIDLQFAVSGGTLVSADAGITVTQVAPGIALTVNVSGAQGKTFKARFYSGTTQTVNVAPEADAYVYDATASLSTNFGTASTLAVKKSGSGSNRESYLRFNVPAWNGVLLGASLKLMPTTVQVPGVHGVTAVPDNSWIESGAGGITWNTKPAPSATTLATWTPVLNTQVSANVLGAITTSGLKSFRIYGSTQTTDGFVNYASRENSTVANRPQLALSLGRTPPEVSITSPADGDFIRQGSSLTITADAQSAESTVTSVAFYDGNTLLGTDTTAPYAVTSSLAGGVHTLTAVATDSNGLGKTSLARIIDVAYPPTANTVTVSTSLGTAIDIDLLTLVSDVETPSNKLRFTLGTSSHGTVTLLADAHTARFTPSAGYSGPANFGYTVTDTTNDDRLLLNYDFQTSTATDTSGLGRDGVINIQGTGAVSYTSDFPAALAPQHTQGISLTENGAAGAARIERSIASYEVDLKNSDWTVTGWFKRSTATNQDSVFHIGDTGGYASNSLTLAFYSTSSTIELANYNGSTKDVSITKTSVSTGAWHHFAIVRSGTTLALYLDGAIVGSDTGFGFTFDNSKPIKFGGVTTSVLDRWFQGSLADPAVFAGALTAAEITKLTTQPTANFAGLATSGAVNLNVKTTGSVTLGSLAQSYDGGFKSATATTNPAGMKVDFTYNGLPAEPSAVGSYTVLGTLNDPIYSGSASGTLVISPAAQTLTFGPVAAKTYGDAPFALQATASSGLAVRYASSNTAVATVAGNIVTVVGAGSALITASQSGDTNFAAAANVSQSFTVSKPSSYAWVGGAGNWSSTAATGGWNSPYLPDAAGVSADLRAATGNVTVNGIYTIGTLAIQNRTLANGPGTVIFDTPAGSAALNHGSSTFNLAASLQLNRPLVVTGTLDTGSVTPQFSGTISEVGSQSITLLNTSATSGDIRYLFSGVNTFSGGLIVGSGTSVRPAVAGALGSGPVTLRGTSGTTASAALVPTASIVLANPIVFDGTTPFTNFTSQISFPTTGLNVTFSGQFSGHVNTGSPGLSINGGILRLAGTSPNTWTVGGNLRLISGGTLVLDKAEALPVSGGGVDFRSAASLLLNAATTLTSPVIIGSALSSGNVTVGTTPEFAGTATIASTTTLDLNNLTTGDLRLTAEGPASLNFATLITDGTGAKSVTKTGTGTVALTRAAGNTYDGGTTVSAGTLLAANTSGSATGTGAVTVALGAALGGTGIISGPITLQSGGGLVFKLGADPASHDSLALDSTLDFGASPALTVTAGETAPAPGVYSLLTATGGITGTLPKAIVPAGFVATLSLSGSATILNLELQPTPAGNVDSDGDGLTNAQEFVFGSDPALPGTGSFLAMASTGSGITLTFVASQASGAAYIGLTRHYAVETSIDLTNSGSWTPLAGYSDIVGANQTVTITLPSAGPRCFFRLKVLLE